MSELLRGLRGVSAVAVELRNLKLVVFDLDGTLWDHPYISSTSPPYRRVKRDEIVDSQEERIRLRPCARRLLEELRVRGYRLAVASWNLPGPALETLRALGFFSCLTRWRWSFTPIRT